MKKIFFYSVFLIFNSAFSFGQEIEWQKVIGGLSRDVLTSMAKTSDGGFICGGSSSSDISCQKTANSHNGTKDFWIVKLDSAGNIQWDKTIGGDGEDELLSISQTSDGGYICGGISESNISGDKTENNIGMEDYWVVKLDATGNIQWDNTIGGSDVDELTNVQQTFDGGYICGGRSQSLIGADKSEDMIGMWDYWIVKLDAAGNIVWDNTIGGTSIDWFGEIKQANDGGFICTGSSASGISGDKTEDFTGGVVLNSDGWVLKLDTNGTIVWQNTIGGTGDENMDHVTPTNDGGYILGGLSTSNISGDKTENCVGGTDYWVVKIDSLGTVQWDNTIGGTEDEAITCIIQTSDGGCLVGGNSKSNISGDKSEPCYSFTNLVGQYTGDYWILKLDSTGNIQWQNTIGTERQECLSMVTETGNGYFCAGFSDSDISVDKTVTNCSITNYDYWGIKLFDNANLIQGKTFYDLNSNFVQDIGEPNAPALKITEQNTGRFSFSQQNGTYNVAVLDTGNYTVAPQSINNFIVTPVLQNANFTATNQVDSMNDFAYQPISLINDLCISITPTGFFRTGFNGNYQINYENNGTTLQNATVVFSHNNDMTFVYSTITPANITADSIIWNLGNLAPLQSGSIVVTLNVGASLTVGTVTNSSVRIDPTINDANPSCNFDTANVTIRSSFDPNDILVNEDSLLTTQLPSQPWLDYTIRFQNTGNDTAFTVNVLNPIDTNKLELSSIEFVNSSHPVNLNWIPWERNMEFKFNNIVLPDSNINEPLSHGFVHYRIKPKTTLLAGDSITNNAYIYFDFNAPVATNTAITKIVLPTGISDVRFENYDLKVFPNPAKDEITIAGYTLQNNQPAVLKIYDVMGKEVFSQSNINHTSQIVNLKSFTSGVYFLQLQTGAKVSRVKFVKQ